MDSREHWDRVYREKAPDQVSWFQPEATVSLDLIQSLGDLGAAVLDVGGGASTLVDGLLDMGFHRVTVMDLSRAALRQARRRLGATNDRVNWVVGDALAVPYRPGCVDLWHDRAVFHFLTASSDRERYVAQVRQTVRAGGFVLLATFAEDGPTRCSGLAVARYSPAQLHGQFGRDFRLLASRHETHRTPWGITQGFTYCLCRFEPHAAMRPAA